MIAAFPGTKNGMYIAKPEFFFLGIRLLSDLQESWEAVSNSTVEID